MNECRLYFACIFSFFLYFCHSVKYIMLNFGNVSDGKHPSMLQYATHCGAILGIFMIFRYLFLIIAGFTSDLFLFLYKYVLVIGDFLIIYFFYFKYKFLDKNDVKGMGNCLLFVILMCFFASFFEGAIAYAHYKFIDPVYYSKLIHPWAEMVNAIPKQIPNYPPDALAMLNTIFTSKFYHISLLFISNIIMGTFLGLFMGFFIKNDSKLKGF